MQNNLFNKSRNSDDKTNVDTLNNSYKYVREDTLKRSSQGEESFEVEKPNIKVTDLIKSS